MCVRVWSLVKVRVGVMCVCAVYVQVCVHCVFLCVGEWGACVWFDLCACVFLTCIVMALCFVCVRVYVCVRE